MPKVPYTKPALDYSHQLQQLKDRGLIIENESKALHLLEHLSYYRFSGYLYPFLEQPKENHVFKKGATFHTAFKLYCFDRELRKFIMAELEKIEVAIRAKMIYVLAHKHGAYWYENPALFVDANLFSSAQGKLASEYKRSAEPFILSFKKKYTTKMPPCWMLFEISSFGSLSMLYSNLKPNTGKRDIADHFGLDETTFQSWLHSFTYLRNVCAHHSRLWNKQLKISPVIPLAPKNTFIRITKKPNPIPNAKPVSNNNRAYFLLCMVIYLLNTINPKHTTKFRLHMLLKRYPVVDVKAMGFPDGWEKEPLWDWAKVIQGRKLHNRIKRSILRKFKSLKW
ncbi:MAG TPA: Abi family protein [Flavobacterium sp.]|nr:Abi family protein [Flavobacterium sp.]